MTASLNPALKPFWRTKADLKILKGGRASSKTWDAAGFAVFLASRYRVKFLCMRQFQNKIQESVYAILKIQIERFGLLDQFDIQKTIIRHKVTGSEFHFYGIHRNIAEIKGFEGADIGWIEEGEGLTKQQWEIIEPTLRKEGAEAWILYNPRLVADYIEGFTHDPDNGVIVRHINYDENPFLSDTMMRKINRMKEQDFEQYQHIYKGVPLSDDDDVVIKRSWIEAAIDAHVKLGIGIGESGRIGFDVADGGDDDCAQILAKGIVATWGEIWSAGEDELNESCQRVYQKAMETNSAISYDSIGVGAGCGSNFDKINKVRSGESGYVQISYAKFIAGAGVQNPKKLYIDDQDSKVSNKDFFENLKAQAWWMLSDRFRNTFNAVTKGHEFPEGELISISSDMPHLKQLVTELSTPKRRFSKSSKVMVESKDDLKKREVESPNYADAFVMAFHEPAHSNSALEFARLRKARRG